MNLKPDAPMVSRSVMVHSFVNAPAPEFLDELIALAESAQASDIHLDPSDQYSLVRLRIDGALRDLGTFDRALHEERVARIKVLAGLRTDEHMAPQDGRFRRSRADGATMDVRVSVVPGYAGEHAVLRLLAERGGASTLEALGFSSENERAIRAALGRPDGMILATGPTGSGKTTTLYAMLQILNARDVSIVTLEDPIEYAIDGLTQIQIEERRGFTFERGLRSVVRQDPDIIMVGEIRDPETAGLAVNAALTGHRVLSTLHTKDAASIVPRLIDMGVDPYLVASTVALVVGQRLARRVCAACRTSYALSPMERAYINERFPEMHKVRFLAGRGCAACNGSGFAGRVCLAEVLVVDEVVRGAILEKAHASALAALAYERGMKSLYLDGIEKAAAGVTTLGEVLRVLGE